VISITWAENVINFRFRSPFEKETFVGWRDGGGSAILSWNGEFEIAFGFASSSAGDDGERLKTSGDEIEARVYECAKKLYEF